MWREDIDGHWQQEVAVVLTGIKEWRLQHPRASLQEIEAALDERWATARARLLQDLALVSAAAKVDDGAVGERPSCPACGRSMEARGDEVRTLTTTYNQPITLTRSYAHCPACGAGLFPPR
jgi:predicted RNA-binding Zn-ribbon protein involved in translation (DUF1610 family)